MELQKQLGTVAQWNPRGFGLLLADNGGEFFVHHTAIAGTGRRKGLVEGQRVEFQVGRHHEGKVHANAANVKVVEHSQGHKEDRSRPRESGGTNEEGKIMSNTLFIEYQGKWTELYETELTDLESSRLRIHRAPHACRFLGCEHSDWYISDRVLAYHERKRTAEPYWKMPTSCPKHRRLSKQQHLAKANNTLCPSTSKRSFDNEPEAQDYASTLASKQHVYNCDDCGQWHLSSLSPEQMVELEERQKQRERESYIGSVGKKMILAAASAPAVPAPALVPKPIPAPVAAHVAAPAAAVSMESKEAEACERYRRGDRVADIAADLHISTPTIYAWLRQNNVPKRAVGRPSTLTNSPSTSPFKPPVDLDEEEARALAVVEEIRRKKKVLEEAKSLRVELVGGSAFRITKEGERAVLPITELEPLIEKLLTLVPESTQGVTEHGSSLPS